MEKKMTEAIEKIQGVGIILLTIYLYALVEKL